MSDTTTQATYSAGSVTPTQPPLGILARETLEERGTVGFEIAPQRVGQESVAVSEPAGLDERLHLRDKSGGELGVDPGQRVAIGASTTRLRHPLSVSSRVSPKSPKRHNCRVLAPPPACTYYRHVRRGRPAPIHRDSDHRAGADSNARASPERARRLRVARARPGACAARRG